MITSWLRHTSAAFATLVVAVSSALVSSPAAAGTVKDTGSARSQRQTYVALGDSYSSGEGTGSYLSGTDRRKNRCHRSPVAYGPLLRAPESPPDAFSFVACSGALTHDFYHRNHRFKDEPAQLKALSDQTGAVTLTIGGNDVGFAQVAAVCLHTALGELPGLGFGCSDSKLVNRSVQLRLGGLAGTVRAADPAGYAITPVATVLRDIHSRAPGASIYLAGYPDLFGSSREHFRSDKAAPSGHSCLVNRRLGARVDFADAQWFNKSTHRLNAVFIEAVRQSTADGISAHYVAPAGFAGHGLCDAAEPWVRPITIKAKGNPFAESFHPTPAGQAGGYLPAFQQAGLVFDGRAPVS